MAIRKLVYTDEAKKIEVTGTWMCSQFVVQPSQEAVWVFRKLSHQISVQEKVTGTRSQRGGKKLKEFRFDCCPEAVKPSEQYERQSGYPYMRVATHEIKFGFESWPPRYAGAQANLNQPVNVWYSLRGRARWSSRIGVWVIKALPPR